MRRFAIYFVICLAPHSMLMTQQSCYWHNKNPFPTGFLQFDKCVVAICFTLEIKLQMSLVTLMAVSTVAVPICCLTRCCRIPCFCNSLLCINLLSEWRFQVRLTVQVCVLCLAVSLHSKVWSGCKYKFHAIECEQCKEHNPENENYVNMCCASVSYHRSGEEAQVWEYNPRLAEFLPVP